MNFIKQFEIDHADLAILIPLESREDLPIWLQVTSDYEPDDFDPDLRRPLDFD